MAQKKIDDVKSSEKVTPSATSRPIIVTNRPVIDNDPMVVKQDEAPTDSAETKVTVRTAKTIQPVSKDLQADAAKAPEQEAEKPLEAPKRADEKTETEETTAAAETETEEPELTESTAAAEASEPTNTADSNEELPQRDVDAAAAAADAEAEAARQAREAELERLIASGKYAVPINAVSRKRSRMHVIFFCLLGLLLVIALADVLLDMGTISAPHVIPHTHFFSAQ